MAFLVLIATQAARTESDYNRLLLGDVLTTIILCVLAVSAWIKLRRTRKAHKSSSSAA